MELHYNKPKSMGSFLKFLGKSINFSAHGSGLKMSNSSFRFSKADSDQCVECDSTGKTPAICEFMGLLGYMIVQVAQPGDCLGLPV